MSAVAPSPGPDAEVVASLVRLGLLETADAARFEALPGGVSSDIWKVQGGGRVFCVKRALARLRVEADWFAPVERNRFEVAWYRVAGDILPGAAPDVLADDADGGLFAMTYLEPSTHRLWKNELRDGRADARAAAAVGERLARIHAGAAGERAIAERFPRRDIFRAIRLEPYLEAAARRHPDLARPLRDLSERTAALALTLVHGDVSPKNLLLGPGGPVFLDAECACIGDPAFDLAFCLNHLLLKCAWNPAATAGYFRCFEALGAAYLRHVDWEDGSLLERRAATLLPGLMLARVDGKSPVEYLDDETDKARVRRCARALLVEPAARLDAVASAWRRELAR